MLRFGRKPEEHCNFSAQARCRNFAEHVAPPGLRLALVSLLCLQILSCATSRNDAAALERFEYQEAHMNLPFRLVLYAPVKEQADAAARKAFERIEEINHIMSDYDPESELSLLSRSSGQGKAVAVSPDLWQVLERARQLSEQSQGAFDVTVGPCVNLWRKARRERKMPDPNQLARARRAVGYQHMRLDSRSHSVELLVPDMRLDLGGIAKGFALDEAYQVLKKHGITRALVTGGGDMTLGDPPPGKKGWRIELPPLDATNAPPTKYVLLHNAGLATSGDLFQRLEINGQRYSHIVDPRTGIGLTDHSLVTVIARDGMTADSLTKVVSVLGPEKGLQFIRQKTRAAVRVVRKPSERVEVYEAGNFARYYTSDIPAAP
jgi:thiamine biosynthesis lipoprotein